MTQVVLSLIKATVHAIPCTYKLSAYISIYTVTNYASQFCPLLLMPTSEVGENSRSNQSFQWMQPEKEDVEFQTHHFLITSKSDCQLSLKGMLAGIVTDRIRIFQLPSGSTVEHKLF